MDILEERAEHGIIVITQIGIKKITIERRRG